MAPFDQLEMAREFIGRLEREVRLKERHNGYEVKKPGSTFIGYVRYNTAQRNAGKYVIYAYYPFDDSEGRFQQVGTSYDAR